MKSIRHYINILENLEQEVNENPSADLGEKVLNHFADILANTVGLEPEEALENINDGGTTPSGIFYYFFENDAETYYMGVLPGGKPTTMIYTSHGGGGEDNEIELAVGGKIQYAIKYGNPEGPATLNQVLPAKVAAGLPVGQRKIIAQTKPGQNYQDMIDLALDLIWRPVQHKF